MTRRIFLSTVEASQRLEEDGLALGAADDVEGERVRGRSLPVPSFRRYTLRSSAPSMVVSSRKRLHRRRCPCVGFHRIPARAMFDPDAFLTLPQVTSHLPLTATLHPCTERQKG
jgi:hypothetical protein